MAIIERFCLNFNAKVDNFNNPICSNKGLLNALKTHLAVQKIKKAAVSHREYSKRLVMLYGNSRKQKVKTCVFILSCHLVLKS